MKSAMKLAVTAIAAAAIASVPFACDKDGAAKTENGVVKAEHKEGGCSHAKAAEAAKAEKSGGCSHASEAKTSLAKYEDEAGGCPMHSKATEAQRAALAKGEKVTMVGYVVCASCDLKKEQACKSIFKTESGETFAIVGNDAFEKLAAQTKHGEKKVEIVGTTAKDATESLVLLSSYKLVS